MFLFKDNSMTLVNLSCVNFVKTEKYSSGDTYLRVHFQNGEETLLRYDSIADLVIDITRLEKKSPSDEK